MIVFLWWTLTVAASIAVGASGHGIYAKWRTRVIVEEARITAPGWLAPERTSLVDPEDVAVALTREVLREEEPRGRHHIGVAIGTKTQRAGWNTPTHQFHALIGATWSAHERAELEEAVA